MPEIATVLLVALVTLLWVGVVATVWAVLSAPDDYPTEVTHPTNE